MRNPDSNRKIQLLSGGVTNTRLPKLVKFYKCYQHNTFQKACDYVGIKKNIGYLGIKQIEQDEFGNIFKPQDQRHFKLAQKIKVIKYARQFGLFRAQNRYNIGSIVLLRWVEEYKNHKLNFNPNPRLLKIEQKHHYSIAVHIRSSSTGKLWGALAIEDQVYGNAVNWATPIMCYRAIRQMHSVSKIPLSTLCDIIGVSFRGYANGMKRGAPTHYNGNETLANAISEIRHEHQTFGIRRIAIELQAKYKMNIGIKQINRYLHDLHLQTRQRGQFRDGSFTLLDNIKNLLLIKGKHRFNVRKRNQVGICDFSQIGDTSSSFYVTVVMDLYGRYVLDCGFSTAGGCGDTLLGIMEQLLKKEQPKIFHSDGGKQMKCIEFHHLLELYGVKQSVSRPSKPRDNACIESFFATMKHEMNMKELVKTKTEPQLKRLISNGIRFYNNHRRHSSLKNRCPIDYRNGTKTESTHHRQK